MEEINISRESNETNALNQLKSKIIVEDKQQKDDVIDAEPLF